MTSPPDEKLQAAHRLDALLSMGQHRRAADEATRLLSQWPDWAPGLLVLATALRRLGQPDESLAAARRALALRPDSVPVIIEAARLEPDKAAREALLRRAVQLEPERPLPLAQLAALLADRDDRSAEAVDLARRAARLATREPQVLAVAAGVLRVGGMRDEALRLVLAALAVGPSDPLAQRELGLQQLRTNRIRAASEVFATALAAEPTHALLGATAGLMAVWLLRLLRTLCLLGAGWCLVVCRVPGAGPRTFTAVALLVAAGLLAVWAAHALRPLRGMVAPLVRTRWRERTGYRVEALASVAAVLVELATLALAPGWAVGLVGVVVLAATAAWSVWGRPRFPV